MICSGDFVGTRPVSRKPAAASKAPYSASVRSLPPMVTSIWRSTSFARLGSAAAGPHTAEVAALGLRLAAALGWYWHVRGSRSEGLAWLDRLLEVGAGTPVPPAREDGAPPTPLLASRARALSAAGLLALYLDDLPGARARLQAGLAFSRGLGDDALVTSVTGRLALLAMFENDLAGAATLAAESLARSRAIGDRWGTGFALAVAGAVARRRAELARAGPLFEESLAVFRDLDDRWGLAFVWQGLAQLAQDRGAYAEATRCWRERLVCIRAMRHRQATAHTLDYLGCLARLQGNYREAEQHLTESLLLHREIGRPGPVAWTLNALGDLHQDRGDSVAAGALYRQSLAIRRALDDRRGVAETLGGLAGLAAGGGQPERALRVAGAAAALYRVSGISPSALEKATLRAWLEPARRAQGPAAAAVWFAGQALPLEQAVAEALEESTDAV